MLAAIGLLLLLRLVSAEELYHRIVNAHHRGELVALCNRLGLVGNAVEVGVWHGGFARHNLRTWHGRRYYMVDAWQHRSNDSSFDKNDVGSGSWEYHLNVANDATAPWLESGRAVIVRRLSEAAAASFADEFFDFIYVDANHEFGGVDRDLRLWWPKLAPGGMMAGDDFADAHDFFSRSRAHVHYKWGVKSAVASFSADVGSPFFLTIAEHYHASTETNPTGTREFDEPSEDETRNAQHAIGGSRGRRSRITRGNMNFPAWYMFKRRRHGSGLATHGRAEPPGRATNCTDLKGHEWCASRAQHCLGSEYVTARCRRTCTDSCRSLRAL